MIVMSKIQRPGSVSEASGHGTVSYEPLEQLNVIAEPRDGSVTSAIILRRTKYQDELPELNFSLSLSSAVPTEGPSFLLKCLFTSVLEDVMTQLWILGTCNNKLALIKTLADSDYLKAIKFGVCDDSEIKDDLDGINVNNLNCTLYKIRKLEADRKYVNKVMVATFMGLVKFSTFDPLVSYITSIEELGRYRTNLAEDENKRKTLLKELRRQVRQQRNHAKTVLYDSDDTITKLSTRVEDAVLNAEIRSRHMDSWQKSRAEQHTQTIFDIENKPLAAIEYYKHRADYEIRVHTEVETWVDILITETLEKIEAWMEKFERDMEKMDLKIQIKKNLYQDQLEINRKHEETLERHDVKMKNWIQFKKQIETARLYHEKMQNSATIVQAWWRGLLVRLRLGPYRVEKPKKGKRKR